MANEPVVTWYLEENKADKEIKTRVSYGVVLADDTSAPKKYFVWNNRNGTEDCPKMEDVKFTTRDLFGGDGSSASGTVEAVRDNWFQIRNDSMSETKFTPVGKGGTGSGNITGHKPLSTNGTTKNINADSADAWVKDMQLSLNQYLKPTVSNGFIYKVIQAGMSGETEPVWVATDGAELVDGSAKLKAYRIMNKPAEFEILGLANNTLADGSNATDAGGNFVEFSVQADVPVNATSGKNVLKFSMPFRYV